MELLADLRNGQNTSICQLPSYIDRHEYGLALKVLIWEKRRMCRFFLEILFGFAIVLVV